MKRIVALFTIAVFLLNTISPSFVFADPILPDPDQGTSGPVIGAGPGSQTPTPDPPPPSPNDFSNPLSPASGSGAEDVGVGGGAAASVATSYGDFNGDGTVDGADYVVWRKLTSGPFNPAADANDDGVINNDDWIIWRSNFGKEVPQGPVIRDGGIWANWPNQSTIRVHALIDGVTAGDYIEFRIQVGSQTQTRFCTAGQPGCPPVAGNEYYFDFTLVPTIDNEFTVRVRVCSSAACSPAPLAEKNKLLLATAPVFLTIQPSHNNVHETTADLKGITFDTYTSDLTDNLRDIIEIRLFYWKVGACPVTSTNVGMEYCSNAGSRTIELDSFEDRDFILDVSGLLHNTNYVYRFEAWDTSGRNAAVSIPDRFVTAAENTFLTDTIRPQLDPRVENVTQGRADIYAPVIDYPPHDYSIASAWLYIWEGAPGTARPQLLEPIRKDSLNLQQPLPGSTTQCPVFKLEGCTVEDPPGSDNWVVKNAPIHFEGLKPNTQYNFQFEVRTTHEQPSETNDLEYPTGVTGTPIITFTTSPINPYITPYVVETRESEVWINIGNPTGQIPENEDTTEFRLYIWQGGTTRPGGPAKVTCTYKALREGDCSNQLAADPNGKTPWTFYVDKVQDGAAFRYEIEIYYSYSLLTAGIQETTNSINQTWVYDFTGNPGNFNTTLIEVDLSQDVINETETEVDLVADNLQGLITREDIAYVMFCHKKQSQPVGSYDCTKLDKKTISELRNDNWTVHLDQLTPGTAYDYQIRIYSDYIRDKDGTMAGDRLLHTRTMPFTTLSANVAPIATSIVAVETEVDIHVRDTSINMTPEFVREMDVSIEYWRTSDPGNKLISDKKKPTCDMVGCDIDLDFHLSGLQDITNYSFRIIMEHDNWPTYVGVTIYNFATLPIDFALTPRDALNVTETSAQFVADTLVIPAGIRPQIRRDIAIVKFCFKKASDANYDCEKIDPISIASLESAGWKIDVNKGLNHNTDYQYRIEIWKDVDANGEADAGGKIFDSMAELGTGPGRIEFTTKQIAPAIDPDDRNVLEVEADIEAIITDIRATNHPDYILPQNIVNRWNEITEVKLYIWEGPAGTPKPALIDPVLDNVKLQDLEAMQQQYLCDPWDPSANCVYVTTKNNWNFRHLEGFNQNTNYNYAIEIWTKITDRVPDGFGGYMDSTISEFLASAGGDFRTAEINPTIIPGDGNTTETTTNIFAPPPAGGAVPGDFNNDNSVDAADYIVIRKLGGPNYNTNYATWRTNFGRTGGGLGGNMPSRPDIAKVQLFYWKDSEGATRPGDSDDYEFREMTLLDLLEGFNSPDPWTILLERLEDNTTYHYEIEILSNICGQGFSTRYGISVCQQGVQYSQETANSMAQNWSGDFATARIRPEVVPSVADVGEIRTTLNVPITNLPSRLDIAMVEITYQTVKYEHRFSGSADYEPGKLCQGPNTDGPANCEGRPDGTNPASFLDTRTITMSLLDLSGESESQRQNRNKPPSEWTVILEGLNHFAHYTYWITIYSDVDRNGIDDGDRIVFDTRPGVCDASGVCDEANVTMRSVCVKDPNDSVQNPLNLSTCYDSDTSPAMPGIQKILYDEPNVDVTRMTFLTDRMAPTIVYAFAERIEQTEADIAAYITGLENLPKDKNGQNVYEVWFVYQMACDPGAEGCDPTVRQKKMTLGAFEWKVSVDNLVSGRNYDYRVEVRSKIEADPDDQPAEPLAYKTTTRITTCTGTTVCAVSVNYLGRNASNAYVPVDIGPYNLAIPSEATAARAAGDKIVKDGFFELKIDLTGADQYAVLATIKLNWPERTEHTPAIYTARVNADPLSPDYRKVTFQIPLSEFPEPSYRAGTGAEPAIVADPETFIVNIDLSLRGPSGELLDNGNIIMYNEPPDITFIGSSGTPIGLGEGGLLNNAISVVGNDAEFRKLTLDTDGLDWPATLVLTSRDSGTAGQTFTFLQEVGDDGNISFVIPIGFNEMDYTLTLNRPGGGGSFTDSGHFQVPDSRAPGDASHAVIKTIRDTLLAQYTSLLPTYPAATHSYSFELWRTVPSMGFDVANTEFNLLNVSVSGGTISVTDAELQQILSDNWEFKINGFLTVRKISGAICNQTTQSTICTKRPLVGPNNTELTYALTKVTGIISYNARIALATNILNTFQSMAEIAAGQVYGVGHTLEMWISDRSRDCIQESPSQGHCTTTAGIATIDSNGIADLNQTYGVSWFATNLMSSIFTSANPGNPIFVTLTLVDVFNSVVVSRLAETKYWGFTGCIINCTPTGAGAAAVGAFLAGAGISEPATIQGEGAAARIMEPASRKIKNGLINYSRSLYPTTALLGLSSVVSYSAGSITKERLKEKSKVISRMKKKGKRN